MVIRRAALVDAASLRLPTIGQGQMSPGLHHRASLFAVFFVGLSRSRA